MSNKSPLNGASRYVVFPRPKDDAAPFVVVDNWTGERQGWYATQGEADAQAEALNADRLLG